MERRNMMVSFCHTPHQPKEVILNWTNCNETESHSFIEETNSTVSTPWGSTSLESRLNRSLQTVVVTIMERRGPHQTVIIGIENCQQSTGISFGSARLTHSELNIKGAPTFGSIIAFQRKFAGCLVCALWVGWSTLKWTAGMWWNVGLILDSTACDAFGVL